MKLILVLAALTLTAACDSGTPGKGQTGRNVKDAVAAGQNALREQKPEATGKRSHSPRPVPNALAAMGPEGMTLVDPPSPSANDGDEGDEVWSFSDVDLDGDGDGEDGDVQLDDETNTLCVWWSDEEDHYDAFVWITEELIGFIVEVPGEGLIACAQTAGGDAGCITCDAYGECTVEGAGEIEPTEEEYECTEEC